MTKPNTIEDKRQVREYDYCAVNETERFVTLCQKVLGMEIGDVIEPAHLIVLREGGYISMEWETVRFGLEGWRVTFTGKDGT